MREGPEMSGEVDVDTEKEALERQESVDAIVDTVRRSARAFWAASLVSQVSQDGSL